jgi:MiaB-like tRNA modifying enzyme
MEQDRRKRVYLETYGCTLNQADSDIMIGRLEEAGYGLAKDESSADAIILNTCTVKEATEHKIMSRISRIWDSGKPLVVAGCLTVNRKKMEKLAPGVSIVGAGSITHIAEAVSGAINKEKLIFEDSEAKEGLPRIFTAPILRIPICEGCTSNCYFCQTKLARPGLRSYTQKTIIQWVEQGLKNGAKEIQMTAMDSGVYGMDLEPNGGTKNGLVELIHNVNAIDGDFLVRLGMINPQHVKRLGNGLLGAIKLPKIYKFVHIPVQSGSEQICKAMNRQHTVADFYEIIRDYRNEIPEILITTDMIVGYPGEEESDFEDTLKLIENGKLDVVNLSKFSPRPGTKAKEMRDKRLSTQVVKKRSEVANLLIKEKSAEINAKLVGKEYEVLITEKHAKKLDFTGRNINYKQVIVKGFRGKIGERVFVEIVDSNYGALFGKKME